MSIKSDLDDVAISEPLLQSLMLEYLEEVARKEPERAHAVRQRLYDDPGCYADARRCMAEALTLSTLAATVVSDEDFSDALASSKPVDDAEFEQMRQHMFHLGVRTAAESMGVELAARMHLSDRIQAFRDSCATAQ